MKFLSRLLLLCLLGWGSAFAQTLLPICPSAQLKNNCWSETLFSDGGKYVGEFVNSKFEGQGIEYDRNGSVRRSGFWKEGRLFRSQFISSSDFPFYKDTSPNTTSLVESSSQSGNLIGSNLPPCPQASLKTNCWGEAAYRDGRKYVGEFLNFKFHGKGIEFNSNGSVFRSGSWSQGNFVGSTSIQQASVVNQSAPSTGAQPDNAERVRLLAEVEAERKKRQELEEQLRVAQQPNQPGKPTVSFVNERRVALVIGNATYKVNPLKNPVNDSTDMARSLRSVGFEVIEANNTTLAQMREATRRFADKLGNSDVGLVYYSGHGVEVKGKNYLIPVNADIKREYEVVDQAFDASQFLEMMDNIRGPNNKRVNILIVDACRNNELQKSWRSTNNGLARMDAPGGTFISFATAPGRVAADGVGRNSPYTKHLLQALKQPNVPIEQVFKVVRRNVIEETKGEQIPWENSSLVGDFYFTVAR